MGLAALQGSTDLHQEGGAVLLYKGVLALLRGQVRVLVLQLLGGDKGHVGGVQGQILQLGEHGVQVHLGGADGRHDGAHHVLQVGLAAVLLADDLLPVPLVHINGVEVVQLLVPADGVHVAVQALAHPEAVVLQGLTLPLCQRLHHLCLNAAVPDVKGDLAFHAVQVVVQAGGSLQKQRSRHAVEVQRGTQGVGEQPLHGADGTLGVVQVQRGCVVLRDHRFAHNSLPLSFRSPPPSCGTGTAFPLIQ